MSKKEVQPGLKWFRQKSKVKTATVEIIGVTPKIDPPPYLRLREFRERMAQARKEGGKTPVSEN